MIVEFFGTPGAGKTTTLGRLIPQLQNAEKVSVKSKIVVMFYVSVFALLYPVKFFYWMYILVTNHQNLFRYKLSLLLRSIAVTMKARIMDDKQKVLFIDEGLLQRSLSIYEHVLSQDECRDVLSHIIIPNMFIVFPEGNFSRFKNMEDADKSPRYLRGKKYLEQWMSALIHNMNNLLRLFGRDITHIVYPDSFEGYDEFDRKSVFILEECLQKERLQ